MTADVILALVVLGFASLYLAALGIVALARPVVAHHFLSGFAQTRRANWIEAIARGVVGLAFMVAAPFMGHPVAVTAFGLFLLLTAIAMPLMPEWHRRIAARSVAGIADWMRPIGAASLLLSVALLAALSAALE